MKPAPWFTAAASSYVANCLLGAGVATRLVDTRSCRWLHHAVYISTAALSAVAASSLLWSSSPAGWALLPAVVPLVVIPRIRARSPWHIVVALSAAPFFAAGLILAWR